MSVKNIVCILLLLLICVKNGEFFNLTILHNNDFHSHFAPTNEWTNPCDNQTKAAGKCFGGAARTVGKVKEIIKSKKDNVLFLNAGDNFQGTVWYSLYKWKVVAEFVKMMHYDAMTIGNHEFDDGVEGLAPFLNASSSIPILSCNIDASHEPKLNGLFKKSIVLNVGNHSVGIIGYTTPDTVFLSNPGNNLIFNDEITSIKEEVNKMKKEGIKIIIGLGHSGFVKDVEIAKEIPDLDLIVGGHSHSLLYTGPKPSVEEIVDKYPTVVKHDGSQQTLIVQAFAYGKYLGIIDLQFDDDGNIVNYHGNPILLQQNTSEDLAVSTIVEEYDKKIRSQYGKIVGKTVVQLEGSQDACRMRECNLGNVITDAMVDYYVKVGQKISNEWTSYAIAAHVGGGIRSTIDENSRNGSITLEDIISVVPFGNAITILEMSGKTLKEMLEHSVTQYDMSGKSPSGRFLQVSGLKIHYDLNKTENHRLLNVSVRCANCRVPIYHPLIELQKYKVIVPKYMAIGGDGYLMLKSNDVKSIDHDDLDFQIVSDYITSKSPLWTGIEERITFKS